MANMLLMLVSVVISLKWEKKNNNKNLDPLILLTRDNFMITYHYPKTHVWKKGYSKGSKSAIHRNQ
jgi:hypothetical protein